MNNTVSQNADILQFYCSTFPTNLWNLWLHLRSKFRWRWP